MIFFLLYLIFFILKPYRKEFLSKCYSNEIFYKGKKILKEKLINDYLGKISDEYISYKHEERIRFNKYYNLADCSNPLIFQSEIKTKILKEISKLKNQTVTFIDTFFISHINNFGNSIIIINNAIFFCELIGCNKIIFNNRHLRRKMLIGNKIYIKKLNITIIKGSIVDCKKNNILCLYESSWDIFFPIIIKPKIRINLIKKDILKNLPSVKIEPDELFIHIRGGDIFKKFPYKYYSQPPLCFYEKIIHNGTFKRIYIISIDNSNIIVNHLLKKYKKIFYKKNSLIYDITLLCNAYKIVLSVSSFCISAIKLNDNLMDIWEYDIMRLNQKMLFLHHHLFNYENKYRIHTMKPSSIYSSKMFSWKKSKEQIQLMLEDKCPFDFTITKPNK